MTVRELYEFAYKNSLLDTDIIVVSRLYEEKVTVLNHVLATSDVEESHSSLTVIRSKDYWLNKTEFSTADLLELFST